MKNEDKELQRKNEMLLLLLAEKSVNESKKNPTINFQDSHKIGLNYLRIVFPWPLRFKRFMYSSSLKIHLKYKEFLITNFYANSATYFEAIEDLKFASQFGCRANLMQREWCHQLFRKSKIDVLDQAFLIWTKTINVKKCEVHYGKWDIVAGVVSTVPMIMVGLLMICTALCQWLPASAKVIELSIYVFIFLLKYQFFKSHSFDAYKIGSKYFQSNGWSFLPLEKIPNFK